MNYPPHKVNKCVLKYAYHREVLNLTKQFVAAFDDNFVYRYTNDGEAKEKIKVRYVTGPKNRVLYDIVDKAKNITLPAIAIEQTNLRRDASRSQNKDFNILRKNVDGRSVTKIPQPVPISFDLSVSIIAFYKEDIDQIVSNIFPWCNPYFVISWKVPEDFGLDFVEELRSEVYWSGEVSYENPTQIGAEDKYRIIGNTTFTVKAWLFPPAPETRTAPIYVVKGDYHAVSYGYDLGKYNIVDDLSANPQMETVAISAYPEIITSFLNGKYQYNPTIEISGIGDELTLYGKRFNYNNYWYLSGNTNPGLVFEELSTVKFPKISAYRIPDAWIFVENGNISTIKFENISSGNYVLVTSNSAGWAILEKTIVF